MQKILIFGNSGSGKSTLAREFSKTGGIAHLDLDTLAWQPSVPPERMPLALSQEKILEFTSAHQQWVIEGCYTDLLGIAVKDASEIIFMNLTIELCIENAENRPWEPHKYATKEAQDQNLDMLIKWIKQYTVRTDVFSYDAHMSFFARFPGKKKMYRANERPHSILFPE